MHNRAARAEPKMRRTAAAIVARSANVPPELHALALSFVYFFCLLGGCYVLRPLREEMGIVEGVETLHWTAGPDGKTPHGWSPGELTRMLG